MYGYHFVRKDLKLSHGDGRKIVVGEKLTVNCEPILCKSGLHASEKVLDALSWAQGSQLCRIRLSGAMVHDMAHEKDQSAATERRVLWMFDATDLLGYLSRWCAAQVVHHWDAPDVVLEHLRTGNEDLRADAERASEKAEATAGACARASKWACASATRAESRAWASAKAWTWVGKNFPTEVWDRNVWADVSKEFHRLIPLARAGRLPTEVVIPQK